MSAAAFYFLRCTVRNQVRRQARRLRRPRYAIAALVGFGYFYFLFSGWGDNGRPETHWTVGRAIGPLFLAMLAAWWWLWGGHRHGLVLTPAETHMLVPAPLTRRALVRFKIIQAQLTIAVSALLGMLVTRGGPLPWPLRLLSVWVLLTTLHQHQIAASLVHAAADQQGRHGLRRHMVPLALFAAGFTALLWSLVRAALEIRAHATLDFALERLDALLAEPGPRLVLAPFRALLAPAVAGSVQEWLSAFGVALLVLAVHYLWIQRTDAAFEEGAVREGEKREVRAAAMRAGGASQVRFSRLDRPRRLQQPLVRLGLVDRPAFAITWKNVLYVQRSIRPRALILIGSLALLLFGPALLAGATATTWLFRTGLLLLAWGGFMVLFGPLIVRNDLRMDLANVQTLRTYPLAGRDVVAACMAASTAVVCTMEIPLIGTGIVLVAMAGRISPALAAGLLAAVLVALPVVTALSVAIQNAIALLYPGWTRIGPAQSGGMEAVGQNLLVMIATVLLMALVLIPPLLVGAVVAAPLMMVSPLLSLPAGALAGLLTGAGEVVLLSRWLGGMYDRTDPVAAGLLR